MKVFDTSWSCMSPSCQQTKSARPGLDNRPLESIMLRYQWSPNTWSLSVIYWSYVPVLKDQWSVTSSLTATDDKGLLDAVSSQHGVTKEGRRVVVRGET
ncbi:hypothetical protein BgiBS90_000313 [Biomphalaria glabrata]|nr:hypothetical protein BgiBS90_000313 [Biomphalaria glabrata]